MSPERLVADLRARGVTLAVDGDLLRCRPRSALTVDDLATLRANKPAVLSFLRAEQVGRLVCHTCREQRFWLSVYGVVVCGVCHPPATERHVAEWLGHEPQP